jgi:hypothetical protein
MTSYFSEVVMPLVDAWRTSRGIDVPLSLLGRADEVIE